jgi:hypothetical protein
MNLQARQNLRVLQVLRSLNAQPMTTLGCLRAALKAIVPGTPFALQVEHDQQVSLCPDYIRMIDDYLILGQ